MYAAFLKTLDLDGLESLLRSQLAQSESGSITDEVGRSDGREESASAGV